MLREDVLLKIEDLHVHFKGREGVVTALRGVDLEIFKGETLGLVGESGCGKSVMSQSILRIIPKPGEIVKGQILLRQLLPGGKEEIVEITRLKDKGRQIREIRRHDISIIFQEPMTALSPIHTIGAQITEAIKLRWQVTEKEAKEQAIEVLKRVEIPKPHLWIDSYTFQLSGGMRQRAMMAIALASRPSLLIADEPTTAVDVTIQAQILALIKRLQKEMDMAVLIITHNLGVIAQLAHRIAVMYL
ncbi:unnamed protein product, partial [marine sediment metagenome]